MKKKRELSQAEVMSITAQARMRMAGLTVEDVAYVWECSISTAYRRLRLPQTMTVGELEVLAKACGCSCSEMFGGVA